MLINPLIITYNVGMVQITYVDVDELRPSEYNPRKFNKKQLKNLMESIQRFGIVDPLIVNSNDQRKNVIVGGHFRWEVAKRLGIKKVPVVFVNLTLEQEKELCLRLNQNTGEFKNNGNLQSLVLSTVDRAEL